MKAKISIQLEDFKTLEEAVNSSCNSIRFGPEFCMFKIPSLEVLKSAYDAVEKARKGFIYVTPRLSDNAMNMVREHLGFLERKGECEVVINDLGVLNILEKYKNLKPHLGRQLVFLPGRCPWPEPPGSDAGYLERRRVRRLFYQTSLNFEPSIQFFKGYGVRGVDLDFIPQAFPHYNFLVEHGFNISLHLFLAPSAITRRCHIARFLDETNPESCSRPCEWKAFLIKHDVIGVEMLLGGNVVYMRIQPSKKELEKLKHVNEYVITMSPVTEIGRREKVEEVIKDLGLANS